MSVEQVRRHCDPGAIDLALSAGWPVEFTDGRGCYVVDSHGRRYLDFIAGYGTAVLGHRPASVTSTLIATLEQGPPVVNAVAATSELGVLAERLCGLAGPGVTRAHFVTGGGEALDSALSIAALATGRSEFVSFEHGFHGLTIATLGLTNARRRSPRLAAISPRAHVCPHGDLPRLAALLTTRRVAAIVLEVVQGLGGATTWSPERLREIRDLCRQYGTLLIVDEVLTGLGRTGTWFAHRTPGATIDADLVVVSKALSGGLVPIACVLMTEDVFREARRHAGGTLPGPAFSGYLLGTRCALAVLDALEQQEILARVNELGTRLGEGLRRLERASLLKSYRGRGLLFAVQVGAGDAGGARAAIDVCSRLLARGVRTHTCVFAPSCLLLTPPLTITAEQVDTFLEALSDAFVPGAHAD